MAVNLAKGRTDQQRTSFQTRPSAGGLQQQHSVYMIRNVYLHETMFYKVLYNADSGCGDFYNTLYYISITL